MKTLSPEVQDRLKRKRISIVDYIFRLREGRGLKLTQMADKMGVKVQYLSRILSGSGSNVTLETIVKCEDALDAEIIVCPGEYEEHLIDTPQRLWVIFEVALKTGSGPYLLQKAAQNSMIRTRAILSNGFTYENGAFAGKPITYSETQRLGNSDQPIQTPQSNGMLEIHG